MTKLSFANSINNALEIAMKTDEKVICYGLGATDPKGIFGTCLLYTSPSPRDQA